MARKVSGKQKTTILKVQQKNGDQYVYERKYHYDPQKGYEVNDGKKLIGKIRKGETEIVPTRPKRPSKKKTEGTAAASETTEVPSGTKESTPAIQAQHSRVGMISIVRFVAGKSGVSKEIRTAARSDEGLALKTETLVWYSFAEDGDTWPNIRNWSFRYLEQLPYSHTVMSQDMYHDVFVALGADESIAQTIFLHRAQTIGNNELIALDSTTVYTESKNLASGRLAAHKDTLIKNVYKLVTFYKVSGRQPVAFALLPGNVPDVQTVENSLVQLKALQLKTIEVVSDGGYCAEGNLCALLKSGFDFITHISSDTRWISPLIEEYREDLLYAGEVIHCAPEYAGCTKTIMHEFTYTRQKGRADKGIKKGDEEKYVRRLHVFIYFSSRQKGDDDYKFRKQFDEVRQELIAGAELSEEEKKFEKAYVIKKERAGKVTDVQINMKAYKKKMKYNGFLVLVANKEKDINQALEKYRKREYIEEDMKNIKSHTGGNHPRVWDDDTLKGQLLVQFLALSMHESFESMVRFEERSLGVPNGDLAHDSDTNMEAEVRLRTWIHKHSLFEILHWFDAIYQYNITNEGKNFKYTTEMSARDKMFLDKIGMHTV